MIESLYKQLLQFSSISEGDWNALKVILSEKNILPKTHIIKPGQIADTLYFVAEGAFRSYLLSEGEDITDYFFFENSLATDYASYYGQKPAVFYLEAIEPSTVVQIKRKDFLALSRTHPFFETMGRVIAEMAFIEIEERMRLLHHEDLQTRFRWMMNKFPQVFQRVPQYHIASYLGVKPESLSRIKKVVGTRF